MSYINKDDYILLYGDISDPEFEVNSFKANRIMEENTTGVDGFDKLKQATPVDEDAKTALKMCEAELIHTIKQIRDIEKAGAMINRADGTVSPAMVSSVSSGSESISYATSSNSLINAAASDFKARTMLFQGIVRNYLSGVQDANGVNLLYMGGYPYVW